MTDTVLALKGISKYFPGIRALEGVDFLLRTGEVHALIGENGAGKSTLVKILTGILKPSKGTITLDGRNVEFKSPLDSQALGITAIHQEATMFQDLSVTENIYMGHHLRASFGRLKWGEMRGRTSELLKRLELDIDPDTLVRDLSTARRHMVEIVKALSLNARIVIMDEPTSALSLREVEDLYKIIRQLKEEGKSIVFISHKFEEIFEIADRFTVLRDGHYIGEGSIAGTSMDAIVEMMVGRSLKHMFPKTEVAMGETALSVEGFSSAGVFSDVSFTLRKGEILGFFGLVGAGRSEVMRALFGIDGYTDGTVRVKGREVRITRPDEALRQGMAYIPEDRQLQGTILEMSIKENVTLPIIDAVSSHGVLDNDGELSVTEKYGKRMDIKCSGWEQAAENLSGGNQQKVVLAKWLATEPEILIMDEPTKGIDVATKAAVHSFISELASTGLAIILVSSEMLEILGMADTIVVMHEGKVSARFKREEATSEGLLKAAVGSSAGTRLAGEGGLS